MKKESVCWNKCKNEWHFENKEGKIMGINQVGGDNPLNRHTKKRWKHEYLKRPHNALEVMRINHLLGHNTTLIIVGILYPIFLFFIVNYLINVLREFFLSLASWLKSGGGNLRDYVGKMEYGLGNIFPDLRVLFTKQGFLFYLFATVVIAILTIKLLYQMKMSFSEEYFNVNQKGDARWTSLDEIKTQYFRLPCDGKEYDGKPGTVVCGCDEEKGRSLYIDQSNTNNLIIGMTRSGKGEMYVFNSIDVQSRSKAKPSLVVNDPKLELYKSSKQTLEERGYQVYLLKLDDPLHSMGYNPLQLVIDVYKQGDYPNAELLAQTFAYSIFNPDDAPGESAFFAQTASALLCALIIAHVEDCLEEDRLENQNRKEIYDKKRKCYEGLEEEEKQQIDIFLKRFQEEHPEEDLITSKQLTFLSEQVPFTITNKYEKCINMFSIINTFTELGRDPITDPLTGQVIAGKTMLDSYFNERPMLDRAKLKYAAIEVAGDRTKGSIYSDMLAKLGIFTFENIAKMSAESSLQIEDLGYGDKPIAVFMSAPDYDKSNHFIATVFVRQMYFILAKKSSNSKSGKCPRPVKCILDEFGNMPSLEGMEAIITVCLGRNISFDLYIQAYQQLNSRYGDAAKTIKGNCGNQIYILTNDEDTTKEFSSLIGDETITTLQRSGKRHSLEKTITETTEVKPLINKNQLMELLEGECVIKRVMKRTDLEGNPIRPTPIFCNRANGTHFEYRYRDSYLSQIFPNPDQIDLEETNSEDRSFIQLEERVWDPDITFQRLMEKQKKTYQSISFVKDLKKEQRLALEETLKKTIGKDYQNQIGRKWEDLTKAELFAFISNHKSLTEQEKMILKSLVV